MTYASKHARSDGPGVKPGVKRTHLIDLVGSAAACKAVYAGSIPTPASKPRYETKPARSRRYWYHSILAYLGV
jgi:hypothetical protein